MPHSTGDVVVLTRGTRLANRVLLACGPIVLVAVVWFLVVTSRRRRRRSPGRAPEG